MFNSGMLSYKLQIINIIMRYISWRLIQVFLTCVIVTHAHVQRVKIRTVSRRTLCLSAVVVVVSSAHDVNGHCAAAVCVVNRPGGDPAGRLRNGNVAYGLMLPSSSENTHKFRENYTNRYTISVNSLLSRVGNVIGV